MTTHRAQHARLLIALATVWMTAGIGLGSLSGAGGSTGSALAAAPAGCVQPATATNPVCQTWATTYDHPGSADEHGTDVVADPLNPTGPKVYVTGVSSAGLVETVAYDQGTGRQIWQASVAGPAVQARFAHARLAMAPGGATLYVAGAGDGDVSVTAYDTGSGTQLWSTTQSLLPATPDVTGSGPTLDDPVAIQATAAGVYVTTNSGNTAQVVDYSPGGGPNGTGLQLWSSTITGTAPTAETAAVSPDGSLVYVAGYSSSQSATPSIGGVTPSAGASKAISEVVALDSSTGLQKWITIVATGAAAAEYALLPSSDGSRLVTSGTVESDSGNWDGVVASLDPATGTVQWSITRDTPSDTTQPWNERPAALAMGADASTVYVAGDRYRFTDGQHFEKQYDLYALNVATGAQRWGTSIPGPANYGDKDVYLAAHGSQVALATRSPQSATTSYDIDIRAYDAGTGAQQWQRDVDGTAHGEDVPGAVAYTIVGTAVKVVVTGMSTDPTTGADITTVATTAATGASAWLSRFDTPLANDDHPFDSTLTPDGRTVVQTGYSDGGVTANGTRVITLTTVAVDARTGVRQWATRWDQPGGTDGQAFAVTTSPDGSRTYAVGQSSPASGGDQMTAVAYDTGTGAIAWATQAKSVAASPDGRTVYLAGFGFTGDATGDDIVVAALDAKTGAVRWTSSWDGNGGIGTTGDFADKAVLDPTGRYFIVGGRSDQSDGVDAATVAFDTTAHAVAWSALEHGGANDFDEVNDIAVDPQGRAVYVTGSTEDDTTGGHTAFTIAYTLPGGQQEWLQRFSNGNNEDQGDAIGVSPDGSTVWVAVASASNQPVTPLDIELLGYAAVGGNQIVSGRTSSVQNETPTGLAVSPDGGAIDVVGSIGQGTEDPQNDAYVVTFDPTGAVVSTAEWDAAQRDDRGESITISPDASQLVVGAASIGATSGTYYAVVSYATGRHFTPPPPPKKHPPH